eukprot:TRINITY_DN12082_c0_g1_i4.p2 TRINITY_DN12082_c0_g1~~TRINITY_DN12082_c0_g1_i4.p2  ORF type:complete len:271 (+),score=16.45 TRINITY_DN12082_c0_g1_i4:4007-4819(+)
MTNLLEDCELALHLQNITTRILRYRPQNPETVVQQYFHDVLEAAPAVIQCYHFLGMLSLDSPSLDVGLTEAYDLLSNDWSSSKPARPSRLTRRRSSQPTAANIEKTPALPAPNMDFRDRFEQLWHARSTGRMAVVGAEFQQLLGLLTSSFAPSISNALISRFRCGDVACVSHDSFVSAVRTIWLYKNYLTMAENLFDKRDQESSGTISMLLCERLLHELAQQPQPDPLPASDDTTNAYTDEHRADLRVEKGEFLRSASMLFLQAMEVTTN